MENDPFVSLRAQLEQEVWPAVYMFKFIIPNTPEKIAKTAALFDEGADMTFHPSSTGKYLSISVKEMMLDVDSIMEIYAGSKKIQGLMAL